MTFSWEAFQDTYRHPVICEWVKRLRSEVGGHYAHRAETELFSTVTEAFDANIRYLVSGSYDAMDRFIEKISRFRLEAGFSLYEVQRAFELFRELAVPILFRTATQSECCQCLQCLNTCLAYTLFRFSDLFQQMHKRHLVAYARELEAEVQSRTAELLESERNYKTLVEEINDGYLVIQEGTVVFVNQAFCQMHGCDRQEVIGRSFFDFIAPESQVMVKRQLTVASSEALSGTPFEYHRLTLKGEVLPTEITVKYAPYNQSPSTIGICRDITSRVKLEKRMREAERMADIGQLTTLLSHEIRNPLSAIKLNLQILEKNGHLTGNNQRRMEISVKEVFRLERILQELLDFAKPLNIRVEMVNVNEVLWQCAELFEMKFREKEVAIRLCLDPMLPRIPMDRERVQQAFMNLMLNALDASPPKKEVVVTSWYRSDPQASEVQVSVQDQGAGIPLADMQEIFKPFFTRKSRGTGLGLTNVKRVTEAHGGTVEVENVYPCGAVFRIRMPSGNVAYGQNSHHR